VGDTYRQAPSASKYSSIVATAWRSTHYRQAPSRQKSHCLCLYCLADCHEPQFHSSLTLSPCGLHLAARRHDSNYAMAVLTVSKYHSDCPTILSLLQHITNCNFSTCNVSIYHCFNNVNSLSSHDHNYSTKHRTHSVLADFPIFFNHDSIVTKFLYVITLIL